MFVEAAQPINFIPAANNLYDKVLYAYIRAGNEINYQLDKARHEAHDFFIHSWLGQADPKSRARVLLGGVIIMVGCVQLACLASPTTTETVIGNQLLPTPQIEETETFQMYGAPGCRIFSSTQDLQPNESDYFVKWNGRSWDVTPYERGETVASDLMESLITCSFEKNETDPALRVLAVRMKFDTMGPPTEEVVVTLQP